MRTGIATVPLDYGKCPRWLFERMKKLSRTIILTIREEFGPKEVLKRLADPVWFQSLACVIGFDWNSSGATTTTLGALKAGLFGLEKELGIFICGGKGKTSKKTPEQIQRWSEYLNFKKEESGKLIYTSKITAKVDSSLIQANYQIYHHNFIFTSQGDWAVIQQGMNIQNQTARRYHWLSSNVIDFCQEPHTGIVACFTQPLLNLVAKESKENKEISYQLVKENPKKVLREIELVSEKKNFLFKQKRLFGFVQLELNDVEFFHHPVEKEKFDLERLKKIIQKAHFLKPKNFEELLMIEGVGPKTIRALSLVSEVIYGKKPSYKDPARYSFSFGGKDGTPYPVEKETYDQTISLMEKAIKKAKISISEKNLAQKRLFDFFRNKK